MSVFVNPEDGRPRAGWRLLMQLFIMLLLLLGWQVGLDGYPQQRNFSTLAGGVIVVVSILTAAYLFDRRYFHEYGMRITPGWWKDLGVGIGIGMGGMTLLFAIQWYIGWIEFTGWGWERYANDSYIFAIGGYFVAMAAVGFYEELLFRGYQAKNLAEGLRGGWMTNSGAGITAILVTSVIFGVLHAGNPEASWISTVNIILAGFMLGLPYIVTNSLALPIGLHFSWNFFQGGVFGFAVSGHPPRESVIQVVISGPEMMTGGGFGPEGGLLATVTILLITALIVVYYRATTGGLRVAPEFSEQPEMMKNQRNVIGE